MTVHQAKALAALSTEVMQQMLDYYYSMENAVFEKALKEIYPEVKITPEFLNSNGIIVKEQQFKDGKVLRFLEQRGKIISPIIDFSSFLNELKVSPNGDGTKIYRDKDKINQAILKAINYKYNKQSK